MFAAVYHLENIFIFQTSLPFCLKQKKKKNQKTSLQVCFCPCVSLSAYCYARKKCNMHLFVEHSPLMKVIEKQTFQLNRCCTLSAACSILTRNAAK